MGLYEQKILGDSLYNYYRGGYLRGSKRSGYASAKRISGPRMSQGRTTFRGKYHPKGKAKDVVTKAYLKKALDTHEIGKEVTVVAPAPVTPGTLNFYNLCKNIDKGNDSGDRSKSEIMLRGMKIFGVFENTTVNDPAEKYFLRCVLAIDKTPGIDPVKRMFESITDSRAPVDFTTSTLAMINTVRSINTDRWQILDEWTFEADSPLVSGMSVGVTSTVVFSKYCKINRKVRFNPNYQTATLGEGLIPNIKFFYYAIKQDGSVGTDPTDNLLTMQIEEFFSG